MRLTREAAIEHACSTMAIAYASIGDYSLASDCFCTLMPGWTYDNQGEALDYVRQAVIEKLQRDGIEPRLDMVRVSSSR